LANRDAIGEGVSSLVEKLLAVQDLDCRLLRLQREMADIPARKKEVESRLQQHQREVEKAREVIKARQAEIKEAELEIDSRRERLAKLREQQMQLKTNKEFKAMEAEVRTLQEEIGREEDDTLVLMEKAEEAATELKDRSGALETERGSVQADVGVMDTRAKDIEAELSQLTAQRQTAASEADPEWLRVYDRIFKNRQDRALVSVENGVCGGCHMQLPPYLCHDAKRQTAVVLCEYCGRMLC
jgi:predicted  nucleic acid-binding Zn-ribbon protein